MSGLRPLAGATPGLRASPGDDVLDAGVLLELGAAQPVGELPGVALGELAVDEQAEPLLERQGVDLGGVELRVVCGRGRDRSSTVSSVTSRRTGEAPR